MSAKSNLFAWIGTGVLLLILGTGTFWWWRDASEGSTRIDAPETAGLASPERVRSDEGRQSVIRAPSPPRDPAEDRASEARRVFVGNAEVNGRVVDDAGHPVAGARVSFGMASEEEAEPKARHLPRTELDAHGLFDAAARAPVWFAVTDARGEYVVGKLRVGLPYRIRVTAAGLGTHRFRLPSPPTLFRSEGACLAPRRMARLPDLVLRRTPPLQVRVVEKDGATLAGAAVYSAHGDRAIPFPSRRVGTTDENGCFAFCPDDAGAQWLIARAPDGREGAVGDVVWPASAEGPVDIVVESGAPLTVRVHTVNGASVPGLRVQASYREPGTGAATSRFSTTDDDGMACFEHLPAVEKSLSVYAHGGMPTLTRDGSGRGQAGPEVRSIDLSVDLKHPPIPVRVLDPETDAAVRIEQLLVVDGLFQEVPYFFGHRKMPTRGEGIVSANHTHGWIYLAAPSVAVNEDGTPNFGQRQGLDFGLIVDAPGYGPQRFGPFDPAEFTTGQPLVLRVRKGRLVSGRVMDSGGRGIPDAHVRVVGVGATKAVDSYTFHLPSVVRAAQSETSGSYSLGRLAPGEHSMEVLATGFVPLRTTVQVEEADVTDLDFALDTGVELVGVVRLQPDQQPGEYLVGAQRGSDAATFQSGGLEPDARFILGPFAAGEIRAVAVPLDLMGQPALTGQAGRMLDIEVRRLLREVGSGVRVFSPDATSAPVELDPLAVPEPETHVLRGRLEGQINDSLEAVVFWQDDRLGLRSAVASRTSGEFVAQVDAADRYLVLVRESWPGREDDGAWFVAAARVTRKDLDHAVVVDVARGAVDFRFQRPAGAPFEEGCRLSLWAPTNDNGFVGQGPWSQNGRVVDLPPDGTLRVEGLPAGRGQFWVHPAEGGVLAEGVYEVQRGETVVVEVAVAGRAP